MKTWTQIATLRQAMDRVFVSRWDELTATGDSVSSLELMETEDALVLRMEVPGMDATFKNGRLVVTVPRTRQRRSPLPMKPEQEIVLPA